MDLKNDSPNSSQMLAYYIANTRDTACFEIVRLTKIIREEECPVRVLEAMENAKRGYMKIKHDGDAIIEEREKVTVNNYNVRDFLMKICSGVNTYLGGMFEVGIEYRLLDEDNVNLVFDGKLMEKAIYDGIFGLLCEAGVKRRRVTVYAKDLSQHIKVCIRCEGASQPQTIRPDFNFGYSSYNEVGMGCYAELAIKKLGGMYKCSYGKSDGKMELFIPKKIDINGLRMREQDMNVVAQYIPCREDELERFFGCLKDR